jgi:hypothetical protein
MLPEEKCPNALLEHSALKRWIGFSWCKFKKKKKERNEVDWVIIGY